MAPYTKFCGICRKLYEPYNRQYNDLRAHFSNRLKTVRRDESGTVQEDTYTLCPVCAGKIFGFIDSLKGEIV